MQFQIFLMCQLPMATRTNHHKFNGKHLKLWMYDLTTQEALSPKLTSLSWLKALASLKMLGRNQFPSFWSPVLLSIVHGLYLASQEYNIFTCPLDSASCLLPPSCLPLASMLPPLYLTYLPHPADKDPVVAYSSIGIAQVLNHTYRESLVQFKIPYSHIPSTKEWVPRDPLFYLAHLAFYDCFWILLSRTRTKMLMKGD